MGMGMMGGGSSATIALLTLNYTKTAVLTAAIALTEAALNYIADLGVPDASKHQIDWCSGIGHGDGRDGRRHDAVS